MAINIGTFFSYKGNFFLDERQNSVKTKEDLKNWSTPIPNGFEVFLEETKEWYTYDPDYSNEDTGHFKKRLSDSLINSEEIDNINNIL